MGDSRENLILGLPRELNEMMLIEFLEKNVGTEEMGFQSTGLPWKMIFFKFKSL